MKKQYKLKTRVWLYEGVAAWHFATIKKDVSREIKENFGKHARGFRSIRVEAKIGKTVWNTSIFPNKAGTYDLPIKVQVRRAEGIYDKDLVDLTIKILQ